MNKEDKIAKEQYLKKLQLIRSRSRVNPNESIEEQRKAIAKAKKNVAYCVERYFPHYATSECAPFQLTFASKILKYRTIKAFAQWGRGLAKSVWCDVILPFWLWINGESNYFVLVGQSFDRGKQLLGDLQAEFEANPQIIKDFGEQKLEGSWTDERFITRGCPMWGLRPFIGAAFGMGMQVRGLRIGADRPDLCICDDIETKDLVKNPKRQDEYVKWVESDLIPTMDGPRRRLLYANNRFAVRMIQTELQKKHPEWYISHVPAYDKATYAPAWEKKYPKDYYKLLLDEIGIIALQQEFGQEPVIEGKIFKPEQIIWDKMPKLSSMKAIIGHWDIAYAGTEKSDYNAVKIWGLSQNNRFWYWQGFVKQTKMSEAVRYMCEVQRSLPRGVIILWQYESQFWNDEVERTIREISREEGVNLLIVKVDTPRIHKLSRMLRMQPYYQNNRCRYNEDMRSDNDTQVGLTQLYALEPGYNTHDDSPDADEQCISKLEKYIYEGSGETEYRTGRMLPNHERI